MDPCFLTRETFPPGPPTVEAVMSLLVGVAGRWRMIAESLEFDEDLIDEIDTNNERDEDCLQDCVEKWISRLQPSWEKLSLLLTDLGEEELAQQPGCRGSVYVLVVAILRYVSFTELQHDIMPSPRTSDSSSSGIGKITIPGKCILV